MSNYKIDKQDRFSGGGSDLSLLREISNYKIEKKQGCSMHFKQYKPGKFLGNIEPGEMCCVKNGADFTYIKSKVELTESNLITEDSG